MPSESPQGHDAVFLDQAAKQLQAQREQRAAIDEQIADLRAQRVAVDAAIERLEELVESPPPPRSVGETTLPPYERKPDQPLTALAAAIVVLRAADSPLHFSEIARRALDCGLWVSNALKPELSMKRPLNDHLRETGDASVFYRVAPGIFAIRNAGDDQH